MSSRSELVQALAAARRDGQQIPSVDGLYQPKNERDALEIMCEVAATLGWERSGWKIAATNPLMQQKLRTTQPVCGLTFRRFHMAAPATLERAKLLDPIIECEFFITLAESLPRCVSGYTPDDVAAAIAKVEIGIEIAECRYPRSNLPPPLYIQADGFASGRYVHGEEVNDWRDVFQKSIPVTLVRNGISLSHGISSDVMGNPINAVTWLANKLPEIGMHLQANQVISSGSCNILTPAKQNDCFAAVFSGAGTVDVKIL